MKILYLDCSMGASGDMLLSSLSELLDDQAAFIAELNALKLPGVSAELVKTAKQGITGSHVTVKVDGIDEGIDTHSNSTGFNINHVHINHNEHKHRHEHSGHTHNHTHSHAHTQVEQEHIHDHRSVSEDKTTYQPKKDSIPGSHAHTDLFSVTDIINGLQVSDKVKGYAISVYKLIAEAEAKAHDKPVELIHFHEVGALDAVCDITGVCLLMEKLCPDRIVCSPMNLGGGLVRCEHGLLSVPAPAVAELVKGLPCYGSNVGGELLTPTGAALLKFFVNSFGPQPAMTLLRSGTGMGTKDFQQCNCLRSYLGDALEAFEPRTALAPISSVLQPEAVKNASLPASYIVKPTEAFGRIAELSCNLDDMTGEEMGFALDALLASGALDVFYSPIQMKKNRPAYLFTVLCKPEDADSLAGVMFRHTTTLGIRKKLCDRYELQRTVDKVQTPYGEVRVKRSKFEYDDLVRIASEAGKPLLDIKKELSD